MSCDRRRTSPARSGRSHPADGSAICTTCAGFSQTFDCSRCGFEGKLLGGRLCARCTLTDRLTALLDDGTGRVQPALTPLFNLLVAMDEPRSGLSWLAMRRGHPGNASQLLRRVGLGEIPLTHDAFHELQPWRAAANLEELLMASGVLPAVDKYICSFQRWLPGHLAGIADPEHLKVLDAVYSGQPNDEACYSWVALLLIAQRWRDSPDLPADLKALVGGAFPL